MKKYIKSIIATALLCASVSGVIACGTKDNGAQTNVDAPNNSVVDTEDSNNKNQSENFPQIPVGIRLYFGIRILDDSESEIHCTSWEQLRDNHEIVNDYSVIMLDANKEYKFQGILVGEDGHCEDANYFVNTRPGFDPIDGVYVHENYECEFKYDETEVSISKNGCSYYEFYFTGAKKGACNLKFDVVISYTKNGDYWGGRTETFNLHFIFE